MLDEEDLRECKWIFQLQTICAEQKRLSHNISQALHFNFATTCWKKQTSTLLDDLTNWANEKTVPTEGHNSDQRAVSAYMTSG